VNVISTRFGFFYFVVAKSSPKRVPQKVDDHNSRKGPHVRKIKTSTRREGLNALSALYSIDSIIVIIFFSAFFSV